MMHTQKKSGSSPATEMAPTVALNKNGLLEESNPHQPGAITLSSKQDYNNKGPFDREMKVHYEPEGISKKIHYSVCLAGEMAAHAGSLVVSAEAGNGTQYTFTLRFPKPDNETIPVGANGVMVEHPQQCYGNSPLGVSVAFDPQKNEIIWHGQSESVAVNLDAFPQLRRRLEEFVGR